MPGRTGDGHDWKLVAMREIDQGDFTRSGALADQLLDAVDDALVVLDLDGTIRGWAGGAEALYGWSRDEVLGRHVDDALPRLDALPELTDLVLALTGEGGRWESVLRVQAKHGAVLVRARTQPLVAEDGEVVGLIGISRDISDEQRAAAALAQSELRFQRVFDESPVGMVIVDPDGELRVQQANPAFARLVGYELSELVGLSLHVLSSPEDLEREVELGLQVAAGEMPYYTLERRLIRKDGSLVTCRSTATLVTDDEGEVLYGIGMAQDVTEQVEARETIRRQKERLDLVLDAAGVCTWEADLATGTLVLSDNADVVFGMVGVEPPTDLAGFYQHVHPDDRYVFDELLPDKRERVPDERFTIDVRVLPPDGLPRWVRMVGAWVVDAEGAPALLRGTAVDATERRAHERRIAEQALTDELTGLPNRALLLDRLQVGIRHLGTDGSLLAVLFLDVDRFKVVNDSLGHGAGDELLVLVARRLEERLGPEITVARLGADEFVVVAQGLADGAEATALAADVLRAMEEPFALLDRSHHLSVSIGVVTVGRADADAEAALRDADAAAARAKLLGGSRVEVFDERSRPDAVAQLELEDDLRRALDAGALSVHHQPVVTLQGEVVGFEALVRWEHPTRGQVPPARFVPVAEATGLVLPLGRFVLDEALGQLATWRRERPAAADWTMAVNLSGRQLTEPGLVAEVGASLERHEIDPPSLRLELTESLLMSDSPEVDEAIAELRDLGVHLSVDDFGTGYSSLVYLRRFPVDVLKLDRVFVQGAATHAVDRAIVGSMVSLARALGMKTVAEGVETLAQLEVLRALGCDAAQGYYWSRPLPAEQIDRLLDPATAPGRGAILRGVTLA